MRTVKHIIGKITRVISYDKREVRFVEMTSYASYRFSWPATDDVSDVKCMTFLESVIDQEH
jgi:hypothetical protein